MQQSRINRQPDTSLQTNHRTKSSKQGQSAGADLMNIQRTIGNKAVGSMLTVQTKLTVGPVGDSYEQEADQVGKEVADHIAASESGGASKTDVQRTESEGADSEGEELQMKPAAETIQRMEEEDELQMKPAARHDPTSNGGRRRASDEAIGGIDPAYGGRRRAADEAIGGIDPAYGGRRRSADESIRGRKF